jgi:phosphoglycerate kinase
MVTSHLGRPTEGEFKPEDSLAPIAKRLSELLGRPVPLKSNWVDGVDVNPGELVLLENCRVNKGEKKNNDELAQKIAALCDVYVNDAFGAAHRAHASVAGPPKTLPSAAGRLLQKEVEVLGEMRNHPKRPFIAVLGGAKVSDKLGVIEALLSTVDALVIGGGMCFTFLAAKGMPVGSSICELDQVAVCKRLLDGPKQIHLPEDIVGLDAEGNYATFGVRLPDGAKGLDIGPGSAAAFTDVIMDARTVFWNGPMGMFEDPRFAAGTKTVAQAVADTKAFTVVGGGDSAAALAQFGLDDQVDHVSTGGGASLEYLELGDLPGLAALRGAPNVR